MEEGEAFSVGLTVSNVTENAFCVFLNISGDVDRNIRLTVFE